MALVGVLEAGAVDRILQSVSYAGADVLVLFSRDRTSGHVLFEKGKIVTARLGELRDQAAIAALTRWSRGHYTLIKRGHVDEALRGHVALGMSDSAERRTVIRWLKSHGYQTSVIANPQQALEIIAFLQPDLLLLTCPKAMLGATCAELSIRLRQEMRLAPAIAVLDAAAASCSEPSPPCARAAATVEGLEWLLGLDWTGTRLGVRLASLEETAKIARPGAARPRPSGSNEDAASEEMLALAVQTSLQKGRLTGKDLALALAVLLAGSALIWLLASWA